MKTKIVIRIGDLDLRRGGMLCTSDVRDGEKSALHPAGLRPNRGPQPCVDEHGAGPRVFFGRGGG